MSLKLPNGVKGYSEIHVSLCTQIFSDTLDVAFHTKKYQLNNINSPFYSCVLSYLAMNASEAGGDLALIQTFLLSLSHSCFQPHHETHAEPP